MKTITLISLLMFLALPVHADYFVVVEGLNKDYIAFKLAHFHKNGVQVKLINLPGVGKTLVFKTAK